MHRLIFCITVILNFPIKKIFFFVNNSSISVLISRTNVDFFFSNIFLKTHNRSRDLQKKNQFLKKFPSVITFDFLHFLRLF